MMNMNILTVVTPPSIYKILHQQHHKVSRYSGSVFYKDTRSSFHHFHLFSTLSQVDYIQITQQDQPIYIYHNVYIAPGARWNLLPPGTLTGRS